MGPVAPFGSSGSDPLGGPGSACPARRLPARYVRRPDRLQETDRQLTGRSLPRDKDPRSADVVVVYAGRRRHQCRNRPVHRCRWRVLPGPPGRYRLDRPLSVPVNERRVARYITSIFAGIRRRVTMRKPQPAGQLTGTDAPITARRSIAVSPFPIVCGRRRNTRSPVSATNTKKGWPLSQPLIKYLGQYSSRTATWVGPDQQDAKFVVSVPGDSLPVQAARPINR
jgi:hypothetical protein